MSWRAAVTAADSGELDMFEVEESAYELVWFLRCQERSPGGPQFDLALAIPPDDGGHDLAWRVISELTENIQPPFHPALVATAAQALSGRGEMQGSEPCFREARNVRVLAGTDRLEVSLSLAAGGRAEAWLRWSISADELRPAGLTVPVYVRRSDLKAAFLKMGRPGGPLARSTVPGSTVPPMLACGQASRRDLVRLVMEVTRTAPGTERRLLCAAYNLQVTDAEPIRLDELAGLAQVDSPKEPQRTRLERLFPDVLERRTIVVVTSTGHALLLVRPDWMPRTRMELDYLASLGAALALADAGQWDFALHESRCVSDTAVTEISGLRWPDTRRGAGRPSSYATVHSTKVMKGTLATLVVVRNGHAVQYVVRRRDTGYEVT